MKIRKQTKMKRGISFCLKILDPISVTAVTKDFQMIA